MRTSGRTLLLAALLLAFVGHAVAQDGEKQAPAAEPELPKADSAATEQAQAAPALDPQVEAARAAAERVRLAKETITVDRSMLGVVLLEPLSLPACDRELSLPADLMGIGHGAKQTCRIEAPAALPRQLEAAFKATVSPAQAQHTWIPVVLEDALCPAWMRNGGTCMFLVALADDVAAGALVVTGLDAKAIETHLTRKYQAPAKNGDEVQCGNRRTRAITSHTTERVWALPGLAVSFEPVSRDCTHGRVLIVTALMSAPVGAAAPARAPQSTTSVAPPAPLAPLAP